MVYIKQAFSIVATAATTYGLKLVAAIFVLIVGFKLSGWLVNKLMKSHAMRNVDASVASFLKSFLKISLKILICISALAIMDIPLTSVVALLASAGLAVGIAVQGGLSNLAGGFMLLIFKPFVVGDYIDAGGFSGTVKSITVFYTFITTIDNKVVTLPNGNLTNQAIVNYSKEDIRRVDLTFSVSYSSDIEQVKKLLLNIASSNEMVLNDPAPFARLSAQQSSSLEFTVRAWCKRENYWDVYFDINETVKKEFDKNNIEIPFDQLDVHLDR